MMEAAGYSLYPLAVAILIWMGCRVRGMTLEQIVARSADEHHTLIEIFERHPHGADWVQYSKWVDEFQH